MPRNFARNIRPLRIQRAMLILVVLAGVCVPVGAWAQVAPDVLDGDVNRSAQVALDRESAQMLGMAEDAIAKRRFGEAIAVLQAVLNQSTDVWDVSSSSKQSLRAQAEILLKALPSAGLTAYEQQFGPAAAAQLEQSRQQNSLTGLETVASRFFLTRAGLSAAEELAARHFDRGHFRLAALAAERAVQHPAANPSNRSLILQRLLAWEGAGEGERVRELLATLPEDVLQARLSLGGKTVGLAEFYHKTAPALRPVSIDGWLASGGNASRNALSPPLFPASRPAWFHESVMSKETSVMLNDALTEYREQGVLPVAAAAPIVVGDRVIARVPGMVMASDIRTGQVLWEATTEGELSRLDENSAALQNPGFRKLVTENLIRLTVGDTTYGQISSDGKRVFAILAEPEDQSASATPRRGSAERYFNRLAALDVENGEKRWEVGGPSNEENENSERDPLRNVFFLGPPLALDGMLYLVGQHESELRLFALDASEGELFWWLPLATVPSRIGSDPARRMWGCPVAYADGILICPTAAGLVVAVDLLSRRPVWAVRYPRDDGQAIGDLPVAARFGVAVTPVLQPGWHAVRVIAHDGRVVFVSPESHRIWTLDLASGAILWSRPLRDGVCLGGVAGKTVAILEKYRVLALDVQTGQEIWSSEIDAIAGNGFLSESHFFVPTTASGILQFDLASGALQRGGGGYGEKLGHLMAWRDTLVVQSPRGWGVFPNWDTVRTEVTRRLDTVPNVDDWRELAELERQAGNYPEAADAVRRALTISNSADLKTELFEVLLADLRLHPDRLETIARQMEPLLNDVSARLDYLRISARANAVVGNRTQSLVQMLQLQALAPQEELVSTRQRHALARFDRAVQGEMFDLFANGTAEENIPLDTLMESQLQAARDHRDPFALQRFAEQNSQLSWGQHVRLKLAERAGIGMTFLRLQLGLLELAESPQPRTAAMALWQLGERMENRSFRSDAVRYYSRLRDEFPDVILEGDQTAAAAVGGLDPDSLLVSEMNRGPKDRWPEWQPVTSVRSQRNAQIYHSPIKVDAAPGSLCDRLSVSFDRETRKLRFQGDTQRGYWELEMPQSRSRLRDLFQMFRGWGVGHLLILRLGTQLCAIAPLDDAGEPNARILWMIEMFDDESTQFEIHVKRGRLGFGEQEIIVRDRHGHAVAQVGPVRAGYLCYRRKGQLIAIETATGRKLWQRNELPPRVEFTGTETDLFLYEPDRRTLEIVRTLDGVTIGEREMSLPPTAWLLERDGLCVTESKRDGNLVLRGELLETGELTWEREFSKGSLPFEMDTETLGVLESSGQTHWLDLHSGKTLKGPLLNYPDKLAGIYVIADRQRFYIMLSGTPTAPDNAQRAQVRGGERIPLVKGILHACDRRTGALQWTRELANVALGLDQPHEVPVLVLNYMYFTIDEDGDAKKAFGVLRCLDRRTGRDVYHENRVGNVYYALDSNLEQDWIEIQLPTATIRLDYNRQGKAPEEWQDPT